MKANINQLISIISQNIRLDDPIVEIGSFQVPGQEHYADLRPYFPDHEYIGCDMREGKGVDRIENIEKLSFTNNFAAAVLCLETIEHVWDIFKAGQELIRILKPDGLLVVSTVFAHPIHDHPQDYWRFTPESLNQLFQDLSPRLISWEGAKENPHTVFCLGFKQGENTQKQILEKVALEYKTYFDTKPKESLRLQLRKWRHEPMNQVRKLVAEKEELAYKIY